MPGPLMSIPLVLRPRTGPATDSATGAGSVDLGHRSAEQLVEQGALRMQASSGHVLELTFDGRRQGKTFDARPDLPLIIHY